MSLPRAIARCSGVKCPSATNCRRYTEQRSGNERTVYAAFYARREAGADSCDSMIPVRAVTTFRDEVEA
jgi:hypothetical protein